MGKREIWLDFTKILAIFLVIILHTVCYGVNLNEKDASLIFYYLGTIAIPIFFIVNGYLQLKKEISYKYVIKKICKIVFIFFVWNAFLCIFKLITKGKTGNIFFYVFSSFMQKGEFFHFWFLGSLMIIYIFLPLLSKIFRNKSKKYCITLTILLTVICICIDILNIRNNCLGKPTIAETVVQTFRLWTWFMYFCWGGIINKFNLLDNFPKKYHLLTMIFSIIILIIYEYNLAFKLYGNLYPENFYDSVICIFTTIMVFTYLKKIKLKHENLIMQLGQLTMGIYIIHFAIICFTGIYVFNILNIFTAIFVFAVSALISFIIYKIPKINSIIRI